MWCKIRQLFSYLFLMGALLIFLLLDLGTFNTLPAAATIQTIEEAPNQILYQARHKVQDDKGNTWQVVLFKRVTTDNLSSINLRLVGFPGTTNFAHPQPLKITTRTGSIFNAQDTFAEQAPADNVGQYDVQDILNKLPASASISITVAMKNNQLVVLKIPPEVILEWQIVANDSSPI
ncbi:hypothetical protein NIES4101_38460 [Calothrix sp. NIES-4101]|nr:hypothetical protein NIES4101_38460 [Calothrix sp. NIES-4101]